MVLPSILARSGLVAGKSSQGKSHIFYEAYFPLEGRGNRNSYPFEDQGETLTKSMVRLVNYLAANLFRYSAPEKNLSLRRVEHCTDDLATSYQKFGFDPTITRQVQVHRAAESAYTTTCSRVCLRTARMRQDLELLPTFATSDF